MGIPVWQHRDTLVESVEDVSEMPVAEVKPGSVIGRSDTAVATLDWQSLEQCVRECQQCRLHQSRTQIVFGVGNQQAELMIIGEAPGANEDKQGEPFVGRSGQLLNGMLEAIGLQRSQVYIANIIKCHPPNNRDPDAEEVAKCQAFLFRQIELVQPKLILALGGIAAHYLLKTQSPLSTLRGNICNQPDSQIPMLVTYHPAHLLRTPKDKRLTWHDLLLVRKILQGKELP